MVQKRLETRGLTLEQVINPDALRLLAMTSGGVMRELMRYMQEAATSAQLLSVSHIDEDIAQRVMSRHRRGLAPRLTIRHRQALRDVLVHGALMREEREAVEDQPLRGLYVLSYEDEDGAWFDVHPNALPLLQNLSATAPPPGPPQPAESG